jgi:secreted PhoX family phosphatase
LERLIYWKAMSVMNPPVNTPTVPHAPLASGPLSPAEGTPAACGTTAFAPGRLTPQSPEYGAENANVSAHAACTPGLESLVQARLSRRSLLLGAAGLGGGLAAGVGVLGPAPAAAAPLQAVPPAPEPVVWPRVAAPALNALGFEAVPKSLADQVSVPPGYRVQVLYALGDPLKASVPEYGNEGRDEHFEHRSGDHHDGMEWFGLDAQGRPSGSSTRRGLLAINHEATTGGLTSVFLHPEGGTASLPRPAAEVRKEVLVHGLSVLEVRQRSGQWDYRKDSPLSRRITPWTAAEIHGPARGDAQMSTRFDPKGLRARGTLNNCGTGKTPWNTLVSGEENWSGYFHRDAKDDERRGRTSKAVAGLLRYGRRAGDPSRHGWESAGSEDEFARWNNSAVGADAASDYRHEMNTFGYVVEIDPFDGRQALRKRTALGRFAHETVSFAKPVVGQPVVAYMGDDSRNEYLYKFVSEARWRAQDAHAANRLAVGDRYLDRGTLYVAKFHEDGRGEWLELSLNNPLVAANPDFEFSSAADIAIFTRLAADAVTATKLDRPEWGGINPRNGEVYFTLTNNSQRTVDGERAVDAANPRFYADTKGSQENRGNVNGHIIRLAERLPTDLNFRWDIYLFGAQADADVARVNLSRLVADNDLSAPDGLVFSASTGICWIQTDDGAMDDLSNCMMLAALPGQVGDGQAVTLRYARDDGSEKVVQTQVGASPTTATLRRFLVGPKGCELTGCCETPDGRALFVNIQHPGEATALADVNRPERFESQWPANAGYGRGRRPRSATLVITKADGGRIGS